MVKATGPLREKTYLLTCAPNEYSNQTAHPRCLIRLHCPHWQNSYPWLSKMHPVKILSSLVECAGRSWSSPGRTCPTVRFLTLRLKSWDGLPAGTQHRNDVDSTLIRRLDVESMLCRGCFNIVWPLGINYPQTTNASILYKGRPCMYLPLTH